MQSITLKKQKTEAQINRLRRKRRNHKLSKKIAKAMSLIVKSRFLGISTAIYTTTGEHEHEVNLVLSPNQKEIDHGYCCDCNNHPDCSHCLAVKMYRGEYEN